MTTIDVEPTLLQDPNTPITQHVGFTAGMYGDFLREVPSVLNVAAGKTDLRFDLSLLGVDTEVTSLDPIYDDPAFSWINKHRSPNFVPGYAQAMPFGDEQFAMTICQFGVQHMPEETIGDAIREMVRVTKKADGPGDSTKGAVFINPVFKPKQLQAALDRYGVGAFAGITAHDVDKFAPRDRQNVKPTLWIQKTEGLTPDRIDAVIRAASESGALTRRRTIGEVASRAFGGRSSK